MTAVIRLGPEFFGDPTAGRPVSGGSLYIGEVDLDPEILANQKQISIQQENGDIVDVDQPLLTSAGGYPLYNGSTVTVLVEGDYSLKLLDSLGVQVYYVPSKAIDMAVFLDDEFQIKNADDETKVMQFDLSGVATGTTRTAAMPNRNITLGELASDPDPTMAGPLDSDGNQIQESIGANVASASALTIPTDGNYFTVTDTTNIDSINTTGKVGTVIELEFAGVLTINHDATDLINITGANITTAVGDIARFREYDSGDWIMTGYERASGKPLTSIILGTAVASTSGTSIDFTGIPAGPKRITFMYEELSSNGTSDFIIRFGDSTGIYTSGYVSTGYNQAGTGLQSTAGILFRNGINGGTTYTGNMVFNLLDPTTNTWVVDGSLITTASTVGGWSGGFRSLTNDLDTISLTTVGGTDTFDNGKINISYE